MKQLFGLACFTFILAYSGIVSCKKDSVPPDMGYNYFPNKTGSYIVYDVDSFFYNDFTGLIDTTKFQLKEKIESAFIDNQGRPTLRLERYVKYYNDTILYSSINWVLRDVWTSNRTATTSEKVEENQRFIKLAFPVQEGQIWNGNAQNIMEEESYKYLYFDRPKTINGIYFDSTLQVTQSDLTFLNLKKYSIEKYAKNVGLVFKQVINVSSQPPQEWAELPDSLALFYSLNIMQRINSGFQYTYTVNSFGTE